MKIALIGNQNSGKTTLFNLLTGQNQKIGNWPGVTIEKKSGIIKGTSHEMIDLPGIYSLSPYSSEEKISRGFILNEQPDLIINIVDATNLERSLYLTTQLLELDTKVVLALNMADILNQKGIQIDTEMLSILFSVDVITISALKKTGISNLIEYINQFEQKPYDHQYLRYSEPLENAIQSISYVISANHSRFVAIKLLEEDVLFENIQNHETKHVIAQLKSNSNKDIEEWIVHERYQTIENILEKSLIQTDMGITLTDKIDRILLNRWLGIPIFIMIMFLIYFFSVGVVGSATVDIVASLFGSIGAFTSSFLENLGASEWSISLIVDGAIAGVSAVLGFVPQLMILFLFISLLEISGYMSRISFLLDRLFKKLGLSGKTLIPFIIGTGCSVPAIMSTRTIEDKNERTMSVILTPFVPCSAKLPIITLFVGALFPSYQGLVAASLYFFAVIIIITAAFLMKKWVFKGVSSSYITELPEFRAPNLRYVFRDVYDKTKEFIVRAGTIIFTLSLLVWFLLSFSWNFEYGIDVSKSILASIGNLFSWVFYPIIGELSWGATVSALQGLIAKEAVVSSLAVINNVAELSETTNPAIILSGTGLFGFFTPASAYAFMVFNLFSAPCFGAIGAMKKEFISNKKVILAVLFQTGLAWILAVLVFQIGRLIEVLL
jgi:ferrous iron transport protein B